MSFDDAFVQENSSERIEIDVYYKKDGRRLIAYNQDELNDHIDEGDIEDPSEFKHINVIARQMDWGIYNDINESAYEITDVGGSHERYFNLKSYKKNKLLRVIVQWSLTTKDPNGADRPVPISSQTLDKLHINIAEKIIAEYDRQSLMSEEELKKSKSEHTPTS